MYRFFMGPDYEIQVTNALDFVVRSRQHVSRCLAALPIPLRDTCMHRALMIEHCDI